MHNNDAEAVLAYTAGIIDGEGSILLSKRHKSEYRSPAISVTNTSKAIIDFLVAHHGGVIVRQKRYKATHKEAWAWHLNYDAAIDLLEKILPYMKEEKKVARAKYIVEGYKKVTLRNGRYDRQQKIAKIKFQEGFFGL